MTALVLDAGALVALDRDDRAVLARLRVAEQQGWELRTNAMVLAQVWRDSRGRQARLARALTGIDVRRVEPRAGRAAGELLGKAGAGDAVDATVALLARPGDRVLTSDPDDLRMLLVAAGVRADVVTC